MKGVWGAPRGPIKAFAVLSLILSGLLPVTAAGPSWAGVKPVVPGFSPAVPVALTRDAGQGDGAAAGPESRLALRAITVSAGDTLASILAIAAIDRRDVAAAMTVLRKRFDPRKLSIGRKLFIIVETGNRGANRLAAFSLEIGKAAYLIIEKRDGRRFVSRYGASPLLLDGAGYDAASTAERDALRVAKGDTLTAMLVRAGAGRDDADKASAALGRLFNMRRLQIGQEVILSFDPSGGALASVSLKTAREAYITARRDRLGNYTARRAASPAPPPDPEVAAADSVKAAPAAVAETIDRPDDGTRQTYRIATGDTLTGALMLLGVDRKLAYAVAEALGRQTNLRRLRIGQELILVTDPGTATRKGGLAAVSLKLKPGRYAVAGRDQAGRFAARIAAAPLLPSFPVEDAGATGEIIALPRLELSHAASFKTLQLRRRDTLTTALLRMGGSWSESDAVVAALSRLVDPRSPRAGQELSTVFDTPSPGGSRPRLVAVSLTMGEASYMVARRNDDDSFTAWRARDALDAVFDEALAAAPPPPIELAPIPATAERKRIEVRAGDTLMKALLNAGSDPRDAEAAITVLKSLFDPRKLRAGQRLNVAFTADRGGKAVLHRLTIAISPGRSVEAGRMVDGGFAARAVEAPLERLMVHAGGTIESSLYEAATEAGVPSPVLWELIRAFSYDVDFQREIQRGDGFEVLFERYLDETGEPVREGNIIYAALTLSGTPLRIYRHTDGDGFTDYYNADGNSVRKALLRTPIDGARLTSGYGKRKHPILGYTKMHRGVDFGARRGAPFMAAGDGVVVAAGWNGAYGKYILLRHRGRYSTVYAHLSRIASGIQKGRRVKQGQVIGYVGSTGRSTGPHLHYEVLLAGKRINPLKVKLPTGAKLKGAALAAFQRSLSGIEAQLAAHPLVSRVADAMLPAAPE